MYDEEVELLATNNIWDFIDLLTDLLGSKVGFHIELLLIKELKKSKEVPNDKIV